MPVHAERDIVLQVLSVCLSQTNGDIVALFDIFLTPQPLQNSKRYSPQRGALNARGGKMLQVSLFMLETVQDRAILSMKH